MAFLPVKAKIGGKTGPSLKLQSDMSSIGNKKVNSPSAKKLGGVGKLLKNPGTKVGGSKAHFGGKRA